MQISGQGAEQLERERIGGIVDYLSPLGEHDLARMLIADANASVATARNFLLLRPAGERRKPARLGMSNAERARFKLSAVLGALASGSALEGLEREIHAELERVHGPPTMSNGVLLPADVIAYHTRDMTAAGASGSNYLVGTDNEAAGFVGLARGRMVTGALGAEIVDGLVGNVTIPRVTSGPSITWLAGETAPAAETQPVLGQTSLTPKQVATYVEMSRQLAAQTGLAVQRFIANELLNAVAAGVDEKAISGSGNNGEPLGVLAQLTPASGTSIAVATIQATEAAVDAGVVDGSRVGWATTPTVSRLLQARHRAASTYSPIWTGNFLDGEINGTRALSSTRMPAGNALLGDFSMLVLASWGTLEVAANPYAGFDRGIVGLRVLHHVDVAVRRLTAFASVSGIT